MFDLLNLEPTGFVPDPVVLSRSDFERMYEYSRTLPTGKTPWKTWRRHVEARGIGEPEEWWLGTYVPIPVEDQIGIRWQPLYVGEGVVLGAIFAAFGLE